jgi:hypothetical protein
MKNSTGKGSKLYSVGRIRNSPSFLLLCAAPSNGFCQFLALVTRYWQKHLTLTCNPLPSFLRFCGRFLFFGNTSTQSIHKIRNIGSSRFFWPLDLLALLLLLQKLF